MKFAAGTYVKLFCYFLAAEYLHFSVAKRCPFCLATYRVIFSRFSRSPPTLTSDISCIPTSGVRFYALTFSVTGLKVALIQGQHAVQDQLQKLRRGCDIISATVGRLMDFINKGYVSRP